MSEELIGRSALDVVAIKIRGAEKEYFRKRAQESLGSLVVKTNKPISMVALRDEIMAVRDEEETVPDGEVRIFLYETDSIDMKTVTDRMLRVIHKIDENSRRFIRVNAKDDLSQAFIETDLFERNNS